jgi:hypothetical protein
MKVMSEIAGVGEYSEVEQHTMQVDLKGISCRVPDPDTLIIAKEAMNSPKNRHAAIELAAIRERLRQLKQ